MLLEEIFLLPYLVGVTVTIGITIGVVSAVEQLGELNIVQADIFMALTCGQVFSCTSLKHW